MAIDIEISDGIGEVVINNPPVNALGSKAWFEFAEGVKKLGENPDVNCVVIRAEGKGFQAGVDIKELAEDGNKILQVNRGCYETFGNIYDCPIPVISAVHGYCIGGGIGISGASDIVIASECATFSLPEIDRGALGAATHLMRLFGMQKTRRMLYTGEAIDAQEALRLGGIESVVPKAKLRDEAMNLARIIADKSPKALRLAKSSLNGIELLDPKQSYKFEQGFTLELYMSPDSQEARDAFVEKRDATFDDKS
ncbi:MAG TPA: enoyl-CoA hydratase family protein [Myxococcales bacterium]|jgi:enoyl-CoA hydratase|nr:enoyl-CoA hydratase family protein [Myxococcales bacterium]HIM02012.1 enoyl-CoA hydratase family protein [Myxococcales bacterium]